MKVRLVSTYHEFLELRDDWVSLFEKSETSNIFISWEWCTLWWMYYGKNKKLMILIVEEGEEVIGLVPLMIIKGNYSTIWKSIIRFLGEDMMADYMDFLILRKHKEVLHSILNFLQNMKIWGRIDLKRISESCINMRVMKELFPGLSYQRLVRVDCLSPYIKIEGAFEDYYKSLNKGLKQDIRTTMNKLNRVGEVSFERYDEKSSDLHLGELYQIHRERQVYKTGMSIFEVKTNREFFSDLASKFLKQNWADISVLKHNDHIVSFVFALKCRGVFYYWIPAIDSGYGKYSLGKVHIKNLIEECFKKNYQIFDFTIGDEQYKLQWTKKTFKNYEIRIYRNVLFYQLDNFRFKLQETLKNIKNRYIFLERLWINLSKGKFLANLKDMLVK